MRKKPPKYVYVLFDPQDGAALVESSRKAAEKTMEEENRRFGGKFVILKYVKESP